MQKLQISFLSDLSDSPVPLTGPYFPAHSTIIIGAVCIINPFLYITQSSFAFLVEFLTRNALKFRRHWSRLQSWLASNIASYPFWASPLAPSLTGFIRMKYVLSKQWWREIWRSLVISGECPLFLWELVWWRQFIWEGYWVFIDWMFQLGRGKGELFLWTLDTLSWSLKVFLVHFWVIFLNSLRFCANQLCYLKVIETNSKTAQSG